MLSGLSSSNEQFLNDLNRIQQRLTVAQRQISTGLRVASPSDAPDQVSSILETRSRLAGLQESHTSLGLVKTEVDTAEQSLQSAVQIVEHVRTLGSAGVTGTATADTRTELASEAGAALEQLVGIANSSVNGRYIFSGDQDQQAPYTIDLTLANPVSAYAGSISTRVAEHPDGSTFPIARTAQDLFDSPDATKNVFTSINALRTALQNNDTAGIQAALDNLVSAGTYLNQRLAFYGTTQNRITDAQSVASDSQVRLQSQLSALQDADTTASILDLTQAQTQSQAALEARAKLPRTSLFDFLA